MNALIKTQNGFYCSTIYAIFSKRIFNRLNSSVVVFDESNSRLIIVDCVEKLSIFQVATKVIIANDSKDNWVQNKQWQGLNFIVNNEKLLSSIKHGETIDESILNKCKALQTTETFIDWNNLNTESDIKTLMNLSYLFHDSILERITNDGFDTYVKFYCYNSYITIKFTNMISSNSADNLTWGSNCILEAAMRLENGNIKWFV